MNKKIYLLPLLLLALIFVSCEETRTLRELIRGLLIHLLNLLFKHLLRLVVSPVGLRYCNVCVSEKDGLFIFRGSWLTEQVELTIFQAIQR